jgi:hypothetical protein
VVETGGLENHCTGNGTGGSNPSPSATHSIDIETLNHSQWTVDLPSHASSGAQVEHNKASENCFIAAIASGDVVLNVVVLSGCYCAVPQGYIP